MAEVQMERQLQVQLLKEMENHPAWQLYQAHLELLCKRKEVEKAVALRSNEIHRAIKLQSEIDGINLSVKSLNNIITSLSPQVES